MFIIMVILTILGVLPIFSEYAFMKRIGCQNGNRSVVKNIGCNLFIDIHSKL